MPGAHVCQIIIEIGQSVFQEWQEPKWIFLFLGRHSRKHIADYLQIHLHMPSIIIHTDNGLHVTYYSICEFEPDLITSLRNFGIN
jgi:hypothetical protein